METKNKISYVVEAEQTSGTTFGRGECDANIQSRTNLF